MSTPWQRLADLLSVTELPAILYDLTCEAIVAASPAATALLGGGEDDDLIGRSFEDFLAGTASGALDLLKDGKVGAYETRRRLRSTGETVRLWVRTLPVPGVQAAVGVLLPEPAVQASRANPLTRGNVVAIGSVDERLTIRQLTPDITGSLGVDVEELVGTSLLQLTDPAEAGRLVELSAAAESGGARGTRTVRVKLRNVGKVRCDVLLAPHTPDGGFAFTIMAVGDAPDSAERALQASLRQLPAEARTADVAPAATHPQTRKLLDKLAGREREVVTELLKGNRVPAIARTLYLSQGTVRNHLSTAFRKLGVSNQQGLIDLLRGPGPPL